MQKSVMSQNVANPLMFLLPNRVSAVTVSYNIVASPTVIVY